MYEPRPRGVGILSRNGPQVTPWEFVTARVRSAKVAGRVLVWARYSLRPKRQPGCSSEGARPAGAAAGRSRS